MAILKLLLFVLFALNVSSMFSGFMLARRMGYYLMTQVMMLMFAMLVGIGVLVVGLFIPPVTPVMFDLLHFLILVDFILVLLATILEFVQILPILMKTMQGGPIHSSHITNLIVTTFLALAMVLFYVDIASIIP
ncbi:MAG: hypothetical protein GF411_19565 [Candidatus Lokiarchaeota archaeon]|nr:hypothetical protein [Candidatus Lokiarchaeota archaeon]